MSEKFTSEYFLEASPSHSLESLNAFMDGQSPLMVQEVQEALSPLFKKLVSLSESRMGGNGPSLAHIEMVYDKVQEFQERGVPDEFIQEAVARSIVEGFGTSVALGAGAGALTGGPVGAVVGAAGGAIMSLLGGLFSKLGGGAVTSIKQWAIRHILGWFGLDATHGFSKYLAIALAQTGITELPKLFTDCHFLIGILVKALPPFIVQSTGMGDSGLGHVVSYMIGDTLTDTQTVQKLTASLGDTVCGKLAQAGNKLAQKAKELGAGSRPALTAGAQAGNQTPAYA